MSVKRGIYRIAQLTKWTSRLLGGLLLLSIAYAGIFTSDPSNSSVAIAITIACMAIAEGIAWVLEGFGSE